MWHTKDFDSLSEDAIVEAVLNYGDFDDIKKMLSIIGVKKAASIFRKKAGQKRSNYDPKIKNFFQLYFDRYA